MSRWMSGILLLVLVSCVERSDNKEKNTDNELTEGESKEEPTNFGTQNFLWEYKGDFSEDEKEKLAAWITEVGAATIQTLGQYPFDVLVVFHRSKSKNDPVSFGHTDRGPQETVHFYVDPDYSLEELLEGWTAPHEIAHLSLPFIGKNSRWFSEGYATYLSRRIMMNMGHYTEKEFDSLYRAKIHQCMKFYNSSTSTHLQISDSLMENHDYGSMYWGSSSFFMTADSLLQERHDMRFEELVTQYQSCCRLRDKSLLEVMDSYDNIIGDTLFRHLMYGYRNLPSGEVMNGY